MHQAGVGPDGDLGKIIPTANLPPEVKRPGSSSWARYKDFCVPAGTPKSPPGAWSTTTCACQRKGKPVVEHLRALLQQDPARQQEVKEPLGPDDRPLSSAWASTVLVLMMLLLREPRALLAPCAKPSAVGGVNEAVLAFCEPFNKARNFARDEFRNIRGITTRDFRALHGHLEAFIKVVARLGSVARRRDVA